MNKEVIQEIFEITKKYGPGAALAVFGLIVLPGCGPPKPQITTTIESCNNLQEEVDAQPGVLRRIVAPGISIEFMVNLDGSVTWFSKPAFTDITPFTGRPIGKITEEHLLVDLQGDTDGDKNQNIIFRSICPAAPTPTISPQPSETPIGLLKGNIRSTALVNQGFHPGLASKPVRNFTLNRGC